MKYFIAGIYLLISISAFADTNFYPVQFPIIYNDSIDAKDNSASNNPARPKIIYGSTEDINDKYSRIIAVYDALKSTKRCNVIIITGSNLFAWAWIENGKAVSYGFEWDEQHIKMLKEATSEIDIVRQNTGIEFPVPNLYKHLAGENVDLVLFKEVIKFWVEEAFNESCRD